VLVIFRALRQSIGPETAPECLRRILCRRLPSRHWVKIAVPLEGVRSAGGFLEALAQVEAVGGDHHRRDQSNGGEDHDDFQDLDVEVVSKSA
jgi:hypothetical protein